MDIIHYKEIGSTNAEAKQMLRAGKKPPFCLSADFQTNGYGRRGRRFWSPKGGVYFSIVLWEKDFNYKFGTGYAAVCLVNVIKRFLDNTHGTANGNAEENLTAGKREITVKWVNDINIEGKKAAGILVEKLNTENGACFVIGIGVNLKQTEKIPADIPGLAERIGFLNIDTAKQDFVAEVINEILTLRLDDEQVVTEYKKLCGGLDINPDGSLNTAEGVMLTGE